MDKQIILTPGMCDFRGKLGVASTFTLFMDVASEHAESLGVGNAEMFKRGLFWLTVQTRIRFIHRPTLMSAATVTTWPSKPHAAALTRYYTVSQNGETMIEGKTKWAAWDMRAGSVINLEKDFFKQMPYDDTVCCDTPFARINDSFTDTKIFYEYTVRSTDIDVGGHMNNAAYMRALEGAFTTKELDKMHVNCLDICFRHPCFEGERLAFHKICTEYGAKIGITKPDGVIAALIDMDYAQK